jgi:hypothetical protein
MRDLTHLRDRLLLALGLLAPACTTPDACPTPKSISDAVIAVSSLPDASTCTPGSPPTCYGGNAPQMTCFGANEIKAIVEHPAHWYAFDAGPADATPVFPPEYMGALPPQGCPEPDLVENACCEPASGKAVLVGSQCCYWHCNDGCCGRPFVVEGQARVAGLVYGRGRRVAAVELGRIAEAWRADAADEHASVASFGRFALELLHVGAPVELVADAHRAALDEVEHAARCLSIAEGLDGSGATLGPLPCADVVLTADLAELAARAVHEGCVGETVAAAQAFAASQLPAAAHIRDALGRIADDEARHAELAWRFVRWALAQGHAEVYAQVSQAFTLALRADIRDPRANVLAGVAPEALAAAGRQAPPAWQGIALQTLRDVVAPCAQALLLQGADSSRGFAA